MCIITVLILYSRYTYAYKVNLPLHGQIRSAVVKVGTIESVKSLSHLYSLECRAQGEVENYRSKKGFRGFEQNEEEKTIAEKRIKALRNVIKLR